MFRARSRPYRVTVIACTEKPGCFRWVVHSPDGARAERSGYAFATEAGAFASGQCWRRVFEAGQGLA